MKKYFNLMVTTLLFALLVGGCGSEANYDEKLLETSRECLSEMTIIPGRTFEVAYTEGIYTVNINGEEFQVKLPPKDNKEMDKSNLEECDGETLKLIDKAKKMVISYVKESSVLKRKEEIIEFIQDIIPMMADMQKDASAVYEDGKIYINTSQKANICEWMICHELIHGIADFTNNGIGNEPYAYYLFNEVMTDVITWTLAPDIPEGYTSGYMLYYDSIFCYIGCFQEQALEAYFYGYTEIWKKVKREEFDFFVYSLENSDSNEVAMVSVNNFLNEWALSFQ